MCTFIKTNQSLLPNSSVHWLHWRNQEVNETDELMFVQVILGVTRDHKSHRSKVHWGNLRAIWDLFPDSLTPNLCDLPHTFPDLLSSNHRERNKQGSFWSVRCIGAICNVLIRDWVKTVGLINELSETGANDEGKAWQVIFVCDHSWYLGGHIRSLPGQQKYKHPPRYKCWSKMCYRELQQQTTLQKHDNFIITTLHLSYSVTQYEFFFRKHQ